MTVKRFGENTADDYNSVTEDTWMRANSPTTNFGTGVTFSSGQTGGGSPELRRSVLRFTDIAANIGAGATITAASIFIYCNGETSATNRTIGLHRCLMQWTEVGCTWDDTGISFVNWNSGGASAGHASTGEDSTADFRTAAEGSVSITTTGQYFEWTGLGTAFGAWYDGSWSEYGVVLINTAQATTGSDKRFDSSEDGVDGVRPYGSVTFTPPSGIQIFRRRIEGD